MPEISITLSETQIERLQLIAKSQEKESVDVAAGIIAEWLEKQEPAKSSAQEAKRKRYMKMRIDGRSFDEITEELECPEEELRVWENEIKTVSQRWNQAFVQIRESTNSVLWEMKVMDKFYDLWGRNPSSSNK